MEGEEDGFLLYQPGVLLELMRSPVPPGEGTARGAP